MSNKILFTHNDLDGIGCALIGSVLGFNIIKYTSYNTGQYQFQNVVRQTLSEIRDIDLIYITDIGLTDQLYEEIEGHLPKSISTTLIDHHDSSVSAERVNAELRCFLDTKRCASKIFYDEYSPIYPQLKGYEFFIDAVNAYDTWHLNDSPVAKDLQRIYDYCIFQNPKYKYVKFNKKLEAFTKYCLYDPITSVNLPYWCVSALKLYRSTVDRRVKYTIDNLKVDNNLCIIEIMSEHNVPTFELAWYIEDNLKQVTDYVYAIKKDNETYFSMRSRREGVDLSKLAESYGGGGHLQAAAFHISNSEYDKTIEHLVEVLKLSE